MHKYKNIAKGVLLFTLVVFLYAFSAKRNTDLPIAKTNIEFVGEDHLLISKNIVDKLLIQNQQAVECMPKDILDLNELESKISSHPMIEKAEVYLTVNGEVRVEVAQRKPLARVISEPSFYIDSRGEMMPLSPEHSARVILVYGDVDASNLEAVNELLQYLAQDEFLKLYVTEIILNEEQQFSLAMRTYDFEVVVGTTKDLDKKMNNFKAFYQKAKKDHFPVKRVRSKKSLRPWMLAAAMGGVLLSIQFLESDITKTEDSIQRHEIELAFQQFQDNMKKVSNHLNKGTQNVAYLDYWNQTTQKFIK